MILDFNMSLDYCADWTAVEAWREIVQNSLDSNRDFVCSIDEHINCITRNVVLTPDLFTLGVSKKSADAIGKYGEGLKIAMLVLTREDLAPVIHTGNYKITGLFRKNEITGVETFCLKFTHVEKVFTDLYIGSRKTHVNIEELKDRVTPFSDTPLPKVKDAAILYTRPGKIYVNGLYVCEKEGLTFGYNFAPSKIELNRDRNMVHGIESQLAQYFVEQADANLVFHLLENDALDVSYLYIWLSNNKELKAELARLFFNKYGDGAVIGSPGRTYYSGVVACSSSAFNAYKQCGILEPEVKPDPNSPVAILSSFVASNKKHMRRSALKAFDTLLVQAKGWR